MLMNGVSLHNLHTFQIFVRAQEIITATTTEMLCDSWMRARQSEQPVLLLGEGSNVLFLCDYTGMILLNRIRGITLTESEDNWYLHVGAGENWHDLVCFTLAQGIGGLENLALIPGCTGSAPIQNIGAYGVELKNVCEYVEILDLNTREITRLSVTDCAFGYRDSIFKHRYREGIAIIQVGLRLAKRWRPVLSYGALQQLESDKVTPVAIFDAVCAMRRSKLPDPVMVGNAGSFFKNPIVTAEQANAIVESVPDAPCYLQADGRIKLAAGWLIEQCGLKGHVEGGAAVHHQQALVLINQSGATSQDVMTLARHVRNQVAQRFGVFLQPEVRFIGAVGEIDPVEAMSCKTLLCHST